MINLRREQRQVALKHVDVVIQRAHEESGEDGHQNTFALIGRGARGRVLTLEFRKKLISGGSLGDGENGDQ